MVLFDAARRYEYANSFRAATLGLFAAGLYLGGRYHEPWLDEAQAFLIARDNGLGHIFQDILRYEGSPGLWHFLLWALIRCGLDYSHLYLVSATLACVGGWLLLFRSPFPLWVSGGVVFSYFFGYQYSIVARSYALDLVLLPWAAYVYADRHQRPVLYCLILGLCANCNAQSFVLAAVLAIEFAVTGVAAVGWPRAIRLVGALGVYGALACSAVYQTWLPPDSVFAAGEIEWFRGILQLTQGLIDRIDVYGPTHPHVGAVYWAIRLSFALLAVLATLVWRAGKFCLTVALVAALPAFAASQYANVWHGGLIYLAVLFCLWVAWPAMSGMGPLHRAAVHGAVAILLGVHCWYTVAAWRLELAQPYSAAKGAAEWIHRNFDDIGAVNVAGVRVKAFSIHPWFSGNIFANNYNGSPGAAHYDWRKGQRFPLWVSLADWNAALRHEEYDLLLLSDYGVAEKDLSAYVTAAERAGFQEEAVFPGGLIWKSYIREKDDLLIFRRK